MNSTTLEELPMELSTGMVATQQCGPIRRPLSNAHGLAVYFQALGQGTATLLLPFREHIAQRDTMRTKRTVVD